MNKNTLKGVVGGVAGGGLTALVTNLYYGSMAAATAVLGVAYPLYVVGGALVGAYLTKYLTS